MPTFHALIRTHHITSRKKVSTLRAAARERGVSCLLRSGGVPGLMYVRGQHEGDVQAWVDAVHALRYKDYKVVAAPASVEGVAVEAAARPEKTGKQDEDVEMGGLEEVAEVKDFGKRMDELGLREWWRSAMGFAKEG